MAKKVSKKFKEVLNYTAVFEPDPAGGYVVSVPSLPGCVTQGETFEEAIAMIKDAIGGYLSVLAEENETLPREADEVIVTRVRVPSSRLAFS